MEFIELIMNDFAQQKSVIRSRNIKSVFKNVSLRTMSGTFLFLFEATL